MVFMKCLGSRAHFLWFSCGLGREGGVKVGAYKNPLDTGEMLCKFSIFNFIGVFYLFKYVFIYIFIFLFAWIYSR